jgi:hypothetical protein
MTKETKKVETLLHGKLSEEKIAMLAVKSFMLTVASLEDTKKATKRDITENEKIAMACGTGMLVALQKAGYEESALRSVIIHAVSFIEANMEELVKDALSLDGDNGEADGTA